jgi:hypothetical protein
MESTMAETSMTQIALPADVLAYAAEKGVEQFLVPYLELTKRIFPAAQRLEIVLEEDPEIADLTFIVFKVQVAGLSVSQAVEAQQSWIRESLECCLPPRDSPFVLGMSLVS